jgi:Ca-activated chloride channel family protein
VAGSPTPPVVNVCLAIDHSASMMGEKMATARSTAVAALQRLRPSDIVSVVAYDDVVELLAPATRVSARGQIEVAVRALQGGGGSALYAGVIKCAAELGKFGGGRANRIVVFSHGDASIGPGSPTELGALGEELRAQKIAVVAVGLGGGYNEAALGALARRSDGGVVFLERAADLDHLLDDRLAPLPVVAAREPGTGRGLERVAAPLPTRSRRARLVPPHRQAEKVDTARAVRTSVHGKPIIDDDPLAGIAEHDMDDFKVKR